MIIRLVHTALLAGIVALPAMAYPQPSELQNQPGFVAEVAAKRFDEFKTAYFDKLALRMEAHLSHSAAEMTRARAQMKDILLRNDNFIGYLQTYKDLINQYSISLRVYEAARVEANRQPQDAEAKARLEGARQTRNQVFDELKVYMLRIEGVYGGARPAAGFKQPLQGLPC